MCGRKKEQGKVQSNLQGLGAKPKMISLLERSFYLNLTTLPTLLQTTTALINTLKPCPFGRSRAVLLYCDAVSQFHLLRDPSGSLNRHFVETRGGICTRRCTPAKPSSEPIVGSLAGKLGMAPIAQPLNFSVSRGKIGVGGCGFPLDHHGLAAF